MLGDLKMRSYACVFFFFCFDFFASFAMPVDGIYILNTLCFRNIWKSLLFCFDKFLDCVIPVPVLHEKSELVMLKMKQLFCWQENMLCPISQWKYGIAFPWIMVGPTGPACHLPLLLLLLVFVLLISFIILQNNCSISHSITFTFFFMVVKFSLLIAPRKVL